MILKVSRSSGVPPSVVAARFTWTELQELEVLDRIEPSFDQLAQAYWPTFLSMFYNTNRGQGSKALKPGDFNPLEHTKKRRKQQTPEDMAAIIKCFVVASGGVIANGR